MAPDDAFRLKCYEALIPAYRQDGGVNKMIEACEFIITHADQPARQSLTRSDLLSFLFQRGKIDEYVKRHEQVLKKDPNQRLSLYMLSEIYSRMKEQPDRAAELIDRLAALDQQSGKPRDVPQQAQLAQQYVRAKKYQQGAELYESIAPLDEKLAAWHWKEAAAAWLSAGQKDKALGRRQEVGRQPRRNPQRVVDALLAPRFGGRVPQGGRSQSGDPALRGGHPEDEHRGLRQGLREVAGRSSEGGRRVDGIPCAVIRAAGGRLTRPVRGGPS